MAKKAKIHVAASPAEGQEIYLDDLPDYLLFYIFGFLPEVKDRCRCAAVSKKWFLTQLFMRKADYKRDATRPIPRRALSRCIAGGEANDVKLSIMALAVGARGTLSMLSVDGQLPPVFPSPDYRTVTDFGLAQVARAAGGLRHLHLANCAGITAAGIASVADGCPLLKELKLSRAMSLTDEGLVFLATRCRNLTSLILLQCPGISDTSLYAFATHSLELNSFHLESCPLVTDHGLVSIVVGQPNLDTLKITSTNISIFFLQAIGYYAKRVRILELDTIGGLSPEDYIWIGAARGLQCLTFKNCICLTDQSYLGGNANCFEKLKQLTINNSPSLTDEGLLRIAKAAKKLEFLSLQNCHGFTVGGLLMSLSYCSKKLRELMLTNCSFFGRSQHQDSVRYTPRRTQFRRLIVVELEQCPGLGDEFILWLGESCKGIEDVRFIGMEAITDSGIEHMLTQLGESNKIARVNLTGCKGIGDRSVCAITRECNVNLTSLVINRCGRVSDPSVGLISTLCTSLEKLDMGWCDITDEGVRKLVVNLPIELEKISFEGCSKITDKILYELAEHRGLSLDQVNVAQCAGLSMNIGQWLKQFFRTVVY